MMHHQTNSALPESTAQANEMPQSYPSRYFHWFYPNRSVEWLQLSQQTALLTQRMEGPDG